MSKNTTYGRRVTPRHIETFYDTTDVNITFVVTA